MTKEQTDKAREVIAAKITKNRQQAERDVHEVIDVILSDTKSYRTSLNYAVNYCRAAQSMRDEELRVQCLYILNNISHWRHERAKEVRQVLKDFSRCKITYQSK